MRICVTGGAGYIGSHTAKCLAENGHEVIVYDNLSTGHRKLVKWGDFCEGDIRNTQKFRDCLRQFKPDGIIHFAASSDVGESVRNPGKYFSCNAMGTLSILEAMRDEGVGNIVVSGTCSVYGQPKQMPIREDCPLNPINPYGASKFFMERMLADFECAHGLNWICLRYFNAAGCSSAGDTGELHFPETHLIPRLILSALGVISQIHIFGDRYNTPDGTCIRDYIHVEDLAKAHLQAIAYLVHNGSSMALNLGSGKGYSVLEIIKTTEKISGCKIPVQMSEPRPGDAERLIADAALAKKILNWQVEKDIEAIIKDAWNFFLKQRDLFDRMI